MKLLEKYFELQKEIYEYFGYEEEWSVYPIDDQTRYFWFIDTYLDVVWFFDDKEAYENEDGMHSYSCQIIEIYRRDDYTMIKVDTNTDFNKFLSIYDNSKE